MKGSLFPKETVESRYDFASFAPNIFITFLREYLLAYMELCVAMKDKLTNKIYNANINTNGIKTYFVRYVVPLKKTLSHRQLVKCKFPLPKRSAVFEERDTARIYYYYIRQESTSHRGPLSTRVPIPRKFTISNGTSRPRRAVIINTGVARIRIGLRRDAPSHESPRRTPALEGRDAKKSRAGGAARPGVISGFGSPLSRREISGSHSRIFP